MIVIVTLFYKPNNYYKTSIVAFVPLYGYVDDNENRVGVSVHLSGNFSIA